MGDCFDFKYGFRTMQKLTGKKPNLGWQNGKIASIM
jgi:hypothetical protein